MSKLSRFNEELDSLLEREDQYLFPEFITKLRTALGVTRRTMADDLEMKYHKLFYLELGRFRTTSAISDETIERIADYFGISPSFLTMKLEGFVNGGHGVPQYQPKKSA